MDDANILYAWDRLKTVLRKLCFEVICEREEYRSKWIQQMCIRITGWKESSRLWACSIALIACGASQILGTSNAAGRITVGNVSMQAPTRQNDVFKWLDPTNGLDDADTLHA
ncbi:uncharacterized protein LOC129586655 [Paramacrobiotus metropolitanus]|uniref:uncharacterized protein LOC129586655 n=1 Tax=Paramacrobiotus metropolitanus TaxID=2943436 RepID=UPI0024464811|nr:uncharacterized protein LOC129586655 [Paramacrobiotus metropolitanus]